jgi:hypothetical protein
MFTPLEKDASIMSNMSRRLKMQDLNLGELERPRARRERIRYACAGQRSGSRGSGPGRRGADGCEFRPTRA